MRASARSRAKRALARPASSRPASRGVPRTALLVGGDTPGARRSHTGQGFHIYGFRIWIEQGKEGAGKLTSTSMIDRSPAERDEQGFVVVPEPIAANAALSFGARGLYGHLAFLVSKGEAVSMGRVVEESTSGHHQVRRMFKELEEAGLLSRARVRGADGKMTVQWTLFTTPVDQGSEAETFEAKAS